MYKNEEIEYQLAAKQECFVWGTGKTIVKRLEILSEDMMTVQLMWNVGPKSGEQQQQQEWKKTFPVSDILVIDENCIYWCNKKSLDKERSRENVATRQENCFTHTQQQQQQQQQKCTRIRILLIIWYIAPKNSN